MLDRLSKNITQYLGFAMFDKPRSAVAIHFLSWSHQPISGSSAALQSDSEELWLWSEDDLSLDVLLDDSEVLLGTLCLDDSEVRLVCLNLRAKHQQFS